MSTDTAATAVKLSVYTVAEWKNNVLTKALDLNAYGILDASEEAPDSTDCKSVLDYNSRRSRLAGYIRGTLDVVQLSTVLRDVDILDNHKVYTTLLAAYEPKTSASRVSIMQELITLHKKDDETFEQYGARAIEVASRLVSMLPAGAQYTPEMSSARNVSEQVSDGAGGFTQQTVLKRILDVPSSFTPGYSAADLAKQMALSMIPLGLGNNESEKLLRHTLNHIDEAATDGNTTLEHLKRADTLSRNIAMQESSASALAAQAKKAKNDRPTKKDANKRCSIHGPGHSDEQCRVQKGTTATKDSAKSATDGPTASSSSSPASPQLNNAERAMMASISHIKTSLVRREFINKYES